MKHTPLYNEHLKLNARMVEFAGWKMPVQYTGVVDEHLAVRSAAGIFDVSHMGRLEFIGRRALSDVEMLTANYVAGLQNGQAQYSLLLNERGTIIDDIIVYRLSEEHIIMVVNASNADKDINWIRGHITGEMVQKEHGLIALQGPAAEAILSKVVDVDLRSIGKFHVRAAGIISNGADIILARTGYTGEDGFEIFCEPGSAVGVWNLIMEAGRPHGLKPAGLGARDSLRTEMKYPLYGQDISEETNPLEAGLSWVVKFNKDFIGKDALTAVKKEGLRRKLVGFQMVDPGIPRQGYKIYAPPPFPSGGVVTSGTMSPSLKKAIGIGYVPVELSAVGSKFFVDIRGRERLAEVVETPFYKKH